MRFRLVIALPLLASIPAMLCAWPTPRSEPPASQPVVDGEQLDFARRPITYFNQECGSCHGNYGSFWGEGFAAAYDDAGLREVVEEMAAGPAQAPLEGQALDVQVAYHRSLVDGKPFVTIFTSGEGLAGEVTPGSEVVLIVDGREQPATVEKHAWRSESKTATAVRVKKDQNVTELKLESMTKAGDVSFSHATRPK
jgi:hypothetical protein